MEIFKLKVAANTFDYVAYPDGYPVFLDYKEVCAMLRKYRGYGYKVTKVTNPQ